MKVSITEFRDMIAEAVRRTLREAKRKPKDIPPRSEESILAQRDRAVRGLHGHTHSSVPGYSHGGDGLRNGGTGCYGGQRVAAQRQLQRLDGPDKGTGRAWQCR